MAWCRNNQPDAREGQAVRLGVAERFVVPGKPGNAGGRSAATNRQRLDGKGTLHFCVSDRRCSAIAGRLIYLLERAWVPVNRYDPPRGPGRALSEIPGQPSDWPSSEGADSSWFCGLMQCNVAHANLVQDRARPAHQSLVLSETFRRLARSLLGPSVSTTGELRQ